MTLFNTIASMFRAPTLHEVIDAELDKEREVVAVCNRALQNGRFHLALATARITVLEDWQAMTLASVEAKKVPTEYQSLMKEKGYHNESTI